MRFIIIEPFRRRARSFEGGALEAALLEAGLGRGTVDFGTVHAGLSIVVGEDGLYEPPEGGGYFGLEGELYQGNAVLSAYDETTRETIGLPRSYMVAPLWLGDLDAIEWAIAKKLVARPIGGVNDVVLWRWPSRDKSWRDKAAALMAKETGPTLIDKDTLIIPFPTKKGEKK
jgi:hypothetical protein